MVASRRPLAGVRVRTSLTATLLVAVVLVLAGTGFVLVQERQLRNAITALTEQHAHDLAIQLDSAGLSRNRLESLVRRDEAIVQIVNPDGSVMAASDSIEESPPVVAARPAPGSTAVVYVDSLPEEHDDSYVVVVRGVATADGDAVIITAESLATVEEATGVVVRLLAVGLPIVLVLVGLISYWLTGLALAPVRQLRNRVAEITARDRSARVPVSPAGDEITRLAETMNEMLERLEAASARQRRFVADASHELRSPLTAIRTSQEIALAHPDDTDWPGTSRDTLV
ncbi:MAG: HAMP domain-containing protein, partial [Nocardioidaceae bacterium]